jgi:hypothetical protein
MESTPCGLSSFPLPHHAALSKRRLAMRRSDTGMKIFSMLTDFFGQILWASSQLQAQDAIHAAAS